MASTNSTSSFTAVNEGEFAHLDLNGKIIVKAEYGADIRKIPILNDEITYDELVLMMQRLFKLQPTDEIELKYRDEDNDLVSIMDGNDLSFAIQCSRLLKLKLFVNSKSASVSFSERKVIREELIEIRNRCIELLDKLDLAKSDAADSVSEAKEGDAAGDKEKAQKVYCDPPKELDPLSKRASSPVATVDAEPMQPAKLDNEVPKSDAPGVPSSQAESQTVAQQPVLQQAYPSPARPPMSNQFSAPPPPGVPGGPPGQMFQPPPPAFSQAGGFNQPPSGPPTSRPLNMPPSSYSLPDPSRGPPPPVTSMSGKPPQQFNMPPPPFAPVSMAGGPYQPPTSGPPLPHQNQFGPPPPPQNQFGPPPSQGQFGPPPPQNQFGPPSGPGSVSDSTPSTPGMNQPPTSAATPTGPPRTPHHPPGPMSPPGGPGMPPPGQMGPPPSQFPPQGQFPPPGQMPPGGPGMPPPGQFAPPGQMPPQPFGQPPMSAPGQGPPRPPFGAPPPGQGPPGGNPFGMPPRMRNYAVNPYMSGPGGEQQQQ